MIPSSSTSSTQVTFRTTVSENIEDAVSGELMTRAVTLFPCGHTFNEDTVIQCLARNKLCPLDRRLIERYAPNYTVRHLAETAESHPLEELKPEPSQEAVGHFLRGKELAEQGEHTTAIEALLQALQLAPAYEKAQAYLEFCLKRSSEASLPSQPIVLAFSDKDKAKEKSLSSTESSKKRYTELLFNLLEEPSIQENSILKKILENQVEELMSQESEELNEKEKVSYKWTEKLLGENKKVRQFVVEKLRQIYSDSFSLAPVAPQSSISNSSLFSPTSQPATPNASFPSWFSTTPQPSVFNSSLFSANSQPATTNTFLFSATPQSSISNPSFSFVFSATPPSSVSSSSTISSKDIQPLAPPSTIPISMASLYNAIMQVHFPERRGDFIAQAGILDKIYEIESTLSIEEKVSYIFQKLFTLAASFSPTEFKGSTKESKDFTLSNYSSYFLNINRLLLWQKLPGGTEYLNQAHIKALPLKKKGELLTKWIEELGKNITILNLNDVGLTYLPPEIWQLSKLRKLDLNINRLTAIPAEIGQLSRLRILRLNNNQLTVISQEIGQLSHLQVLGLSNNQLTVIPSEIGQLSHLQVLGLSNNQLTAIPAEIGQLLRLKELHLSNNPLTVIPHLSKVKMFNYGQSSSYFS
jgi:Leucine-rich repeat (LRR) protein